MSMTALMEQFGSIEDPRCAGKVGHRLGDILVCAAIACAESWEDIALYGRSKPAWPEGFLELPYGIPSQSHDTFRRVVHADRSGPVRGGVPVLGAWPGIGLRR